MKRSIYLALPAILLIGWAGMRSMGVLPWLDARASETKFEKAAEPKPPSGAALICSAKSGPWSSADTWEGGSVPSAGSRVQVKEGHAVVYDVASDAAIRFLHVAGSLKFARDRDTCLVVGLVKIQAGNDASENGFDCDSHLTAPDLSRRRPALEVGTPENPIPAKHTATIRLAYVEGLDKETCPAIICCGGRLDLHGAPLARTWVKLGNPARAGQSEVVLAEKVLGWRVGDRVLLTATNATNFFDRHDKAIPTVRRTAQTEERLVRTVAGDRLTLDHPLEFDHTAEGTYRGEVADLSRNVVVESVDPDGVRGHTMYHRHSAGSISYAEFRHLGKKGILGKYALHFHLCGDTMRGSSVIGASIWDSHNRWLTVHGTQYLVVRDCVGYNSIGHGFFLEDGTEVYNVFDRNLAVQACHGEPLPKQILPFDRNSGAGFWWANSLNSFTGNCAVECDQYGYRFEVSKTKNFDPVLPIRQPDGSKSQIDVRTLPFVRFEENETHSQRRFGLNLGGLRSAASQGDLDAYEKSGQHSSYTETKRIMLSGDVDGIGPDHKHPFLIKDFRVWTTGWPVHIGSPAVQIDGLDCYDCLYGLWRCRTKLHSYRKLSLQKIEAEAFYQPWGGTPKGSDSFEDDLEPVDDLPPITVITRVLAGPEGTVVVRGTTSDNGAVKRVLVNGLAASPVRPNFAEWEIVLPRPMGNDLTIKAHAEDEAGNVENTPHVVKSSIPLTQAER